MRTLDIRGEVVIEVEGESILLTARGDHIVLTLERLCTLAIAARSLSRIPKVLGKAPSLSRLTAMCPGITIQVGQTPVMHVVRRHGLFSSFIHHRFRFENKKIWLRDSYRLLRHYFK